MSKRAASTYLTADNAEEVASEVDEAGEFQVASKEEIKNRVIKTAKRGRNLDTPSLGSGGVFANLKSFAGSSLSSGSGGISLGAVPSSSSSLSTSSASQGLFKLGANMMSSKSSAAVTLPSMATVLPTSNLSSSRLVSTAVFTKQAECSSYLAQLESLNRSVSNWISKHVQDNPYVDLTPTFDDYRTHLASIDAKHHKVNLDSGSLQELPSDASQESYDSPPAQSSCTSEGEEDTEERTGNEDGSNYVSSDVTSDVKMASSSESSSQQSSVQQSSQDTLNGDSQTSTSSTKPVETIDDDDAIFSVRSKLFYKRESEFVDLGVGTLKVQSSSAGTVRLLLRNDSSLRNVILNVKVTAEMPLSSSKKSVLLMCPSPNPPLSVGEGPVTYLLRVKSPEVAEELLGILKTQTGRLGN